MTTSCTGETKRGSDDSGTTSDINTSYIDESVEWPLIADQSRTASVERILTVSTSSIKTSTRLYPTPKPGGSKDSVKSQQRLSRSLTGKLGDFKPPKVPNDSRTYAVVGYRRLSNTGGKTQTSKVTDSRVNSLKKSVGKSPAQMITQSLPRSWSKRPVPTPRGTGKNAQNHKDLMVDSFPTDSSVIIEESKLEPNNHLKASSYSSSVLTDSLIDRDSLCNYATSRDSEDEYVDYVNVERICPVRNYDGNERHYATGTCVTQLKTNGTESMTASCYRAKISGDSTSSLSAWVSH